MTDVRRRRKNLVHSFCQKSWILERLRVFEKQRKFDFFQRSLPWTKKGNDGRPATATTDVDGRPTTTTKTKSATAKKSRALILPKILNFRKIASFWKTSKIWFFSKVPPLDEKGKWWTTGDGDDRRRRRPTKTTTDDDENDDRRRRKNLVHSFCQKSWILERLRVFEKQRKFDFFQRSLPWTKKGKKGNDGRPTTAKKSRALILPKILNFRKIASFWKTSKIWFFSKVPPLDEKGKWWTPGDGEKISCTHFAKNLEFQKDCEFLKNIENLIFLKGPSLGRKREMMDDGDDDVGDDRRRRRRPTTTKTTIGDGEKISCTHFAKNLEF